MTFSLLFKFLMPKILNIDKLYTIGDVGGYDVYITDILVASILLIIFMLITIKEASVSESLQYYFCIAIISTILLLFFSAFFSYSFSFESLKTLTKESQGWFSSIIMMVAVAP